MYMYIKLIIKNYSITLWNHQPDTFHTKNQFVQNKATSKCGE